MFVIALRRRLSTSTTYLSVEFSNLHPGGQTARDFKRMSWLVYEAHALYAQRERERERASWRWCLGGEDYVRQAMGLKHLLRQTISRCRIRLMYPSALRPPHL